MGPKGSFFWGNTRAYDNDRTGFIESCIARYGKTFRFDTNTVFTVEPSLVHDLLMRTNRDFIADQPPFSAAINVQKAAGDTDLWMDVRRRGWKGLNRQVAVAHSVRLRRILDQVMSINLGSTRSCIDITGAIFAQATSDYCLGNDSGSVPEIVHANTDALAGIAGTSDLFPEWMPTQKIRRFKNARSRTLDELARCVRNRARLSPNQEPADLLDILLQDRDPYLTDFQIERFIRSVLLAAHGVPAAAMSWIIFELLNRPDCVARLRR